MIHDIERAKAIRQKAEMELARIAEIERRVQKGDLARLTIAKNQFQDVEDFFLRLLEKENRTPQQEGFWLSYTERLVQIWSAEVTKLSQRMTDGVNLEVA